jgi:hypothetical protein
MPQFILSYRSAKAYDALADSDGLAAWGEFLNEFIAPRVIDAGLATIRAVDRCRQGRTIDPARRLLRQ